MKNFSDDDRKEPFPLFDEIQAPVPDIREFKRWVWLYKKWEHLLNVVQIAVFAVLLMFPLHDLQIRMTSSGPAFREKIGMKFVGFHPSVEYLTNQLIERNYSAKENASYHIKYCHVSIDWLGTMSIAVILQFLISSIRRMIR